MKQQHHPTDLKSFEKGINSDANDELMANRPGEHVDANNMRSSAMDGDNYAKKKIKGEEVVFPNVDNRCTVGTGQPLDDGYECMMTQEVNGHIVEIWAHNSNNLEVYPSLIRIDGLIVAMSENFNVRSDFPLEYDKNESCIGGEFFITDNRVTPMVFNVKDLLINSGVDVGDEEGECTQKYFDGFDEDLYQVGITSELFQMAFIRQATSTSNGTFDVVFGTEGLPVGMYSYTYRYVTGEGDRSGWAPLSVQIPVLRGRNAIPNEQYMYNAGNYGDFAAPQSPTTYGNYLRLKYDNKSKFEFIEVRRDTWIVGATLNTPPVSELIGSFPISEGLNVVRILDYASAAQAEEDLVEEDLVDVPTVIQRAKAIRYYNNKLWLMNVGYREKDIGETVTIESPDDAIKPTVQKLFKRGHIDPYAAAYYKSNMRGEAYGIGLTFRDDSGGTTFVVPVEESYQFPNRRDVVDSESFGHSYYSVVRAANVNGTVGRTYEVFDHANAKKRAEFPEEVRQHRWGPFEGGSIPSYAVLFDFQFGSTAVNGYGEPQRATLVNILEDQNVNNPALLGIPLDAFVDPFKVLHPTSQTDPESQYNRRINTHVYYDNGYSEQSVNYNPQAFAIDYYSLGAAFKGIDVSTLPDWVDGFSLVTTEPARRVVAQGLGFYDLKSGSTGTFGGFEENATKSGDALLCNFPDLDDGYGLYDATEYIRPHGPTSQYRIDLVAPLGFFSEFYSYYSPENSGGPPATIGVVLTMYKAGQRWAIDAISHCRVLYDNGQINPGWEGPGGSLGNYVGFGSWRQLSQNQSTFPANVKAPPLVIDQITQVVEPSGLAKNLRVQTFAGVYSEAGTGGGPENQQYFFSGLKKWQEPVYVVNLVREGAAVNVGTINAYNHTGHYQKLKSKILESDGSNGQTAILVSERWEDCIVDKSNTYEGVMVSNAYSDLERFVTVEDSNGSNLWVNVTEKTAAEINSITNDIATNGFAVVTDPSGSYNVYGIYTDSKTIEGTAVIYNLHFDNLEPLANVYVQYDKRIPIRYFGGDTYVNDHIWAPLDKRYRGDKGKPQDDIDEFVLNIPFPLSMYQLNATIGLVGNSNTNVSSRYLTNTVVETPAGGEIMYRGSNMVPGHIYFDATLFGSGNPDWGFEGFLPSRWRQLVTTWVAETRVNLSYAFNLETSGEEADSQMWPLKNYAYRPTRWKDGADPADTAAGGFFKDVNIYQDYFNEYGNEHLTWGLGGFKFRPRTNIDYSKKQINELYTTTPSVGFEEEVDFCTRIIWSVTRPINVQDTPTLKTFPPGNYKDISDDTGEIKFAWDADSGKGNNLYAITNNGVCLLLVDKRIISEVNANELATVGVEAFGGIVDELWIDKSIGMNNETWRTWAEYSNILFWVNDTSSYSFASNEITNLADTGYSELLRRAFIPKMNSGVDSKIAGVYDILHKEYWATTDNREEHSTLIYGISQEALQCQSDYKYDKYLAIENKVYGMKGMATYELGVGNLIDGEEYECYVSGVSDKDMYFDKEFIRIRVNSRSKPKRIEFYDDYEQYLTGVPSSTVDATANPINIKDYHGYECYIPRKEAAPRDRQQGREMIFKIVSDEDENFFISTVGVQYKALK